MAAEPVASAGAPDRVLEFFRTEGLAARVAAAVQPQFPDVSLIRVYTLRCTVLAASTSSCQVGYVHFHVVAHRKFDVTYNWDIHATATSICLCDGYSNDVGVEVDHTERLTRELPPGVLQLGAIAHCWQQLLADTAARIREMQALLDA